MFTGIVETIGTIVSVLHEGSNARIVIKSVIAGELKVDQSVAHNGVCLTVVKVEGDCYEVVAVEETLRRTDIGDWKKGDAVNLERCMKLGDRLDGHIVQGHVDTTAKVLKIEERDGSWNYFFSYDPACGQVTVPKGSICVNGVSLTVVESSHGLFSVTIIPYTYHHTVFHAMCVGDTVNLEFDIIGKYVARMMEK